MYKTSANNIKNAAANINTYTTSVRTQGIFCHQITTRWKGVVRGGWENILYVHFNCCRVLSCSYDHVKLLYQLPGTKELIEIHIFMMVDWWPINSWDICNVVKFNKQSVISVRLKYLSCCFCLPRSSCFSFLPCLSLNSIKIAKLWNQVEISTVVQNCKIWSNLCKIVRFGSKLMNLAKLLNCAIVKFGILQTQRCEPN